MVFKKIDYYTRGRLVFLTCNWTFDMSFSSKQVQHLMTLTMILVCFVVA